MRGLEIRSFMNPNKRSVDYIKYFAPLEKSHSFTDSEAWWHIYASVKWVIIVSGNGLPPVRLQAIVWTDADVFLIGVHCTD